MIRPLHFNYIEEKLNFLAYRIEMRGKLNLLDLHLHSENFYQHLFNELFGWELESLNAIKPNAAAVDLIDHANKIVVQVSATATKVKVESALTNDFLSGYGEYSFKFISISKDAGELRKQSFANPHGLAFNSQTDIYDITSILRYITGLAVDDQRRVAALIRKELGTEVDPVRLESNLAAIINILAREVWSNESSERPIPFNIDQKIDFNDLKAARDVIEEYNFHYSRVDRIYADYDMEGNNKSLSVLDMIKRLYVRNKTGLDNDDLFFKIIDCVAEQVQGSPNFTPIPIEELELCVNILVVDAFIRCKIFKKPVGYTHAAA